MDIEVPPRWRRLEIAAWQTPVVVLGGPDSGKTSFAGFCYHRLLQTHDRVGFIDLDVGQSSFCLPTTIGLGVGAADEAPGDLSTMSFPPAGERTYRFIGSNSPVHHEARLIVALHRLLADAVQADAGALVVDTSGFIQVSYGAADLKWAEIDLVRAGTVVALQAKDELETILRPLRHREALRVVTLPISDNATSRSQEARQSYRARCYRDHFANAATMRLSTQSLAVFRRRRWQERQLVALEDEAARAMALGLIEAWADDWIHVLTPLREAEKVRALHAGGLRLAPGSFRDRSL